MLLTIIVAVLIFILLWWLISIIPLPASAPVHIRTVLYIVLIVVAILWLAKFGGVSL